MTQYGYGLIELLIALGFVSLTLISVSAATLYAEHNLAVINQTRCAEQILTNIAEELLSTQNSWTAGQQTHWRVEAAQWLTGATLRLNRQHIEVHWPAHAPLNIHCQPIDSTHSCLGLDLSAT